MTRDVAFSVTFEHRLRFTRDALNPANGLLRRAVEPDTDEPARALCFIDAQLARARPDLPRRLSDYARAHADRLSLDSAPVLVPGGEAVKNDRRQLERILGAIYKARLCRHSYVIVIGGGAVLDIVGFAAATAHRGVRLVRMPSTTLSQTDSGIGVKNGVNAFGRKNFLGTFSPPWAVICDTDLLRTLSDRDWRCGFAEAVKVALVRDARLFASIASRAARIRARSAAAALPIIRRSARLHLQHIATCGDPFELTRARPLDFGHWAAHRLEELTAYRLRHGEAVAIGIAIDTTYAALAGHLDPDAAEAVRRCLSELGFTLYDAALSDADALLAGLEEFREHLGGPLTITLLRAIGEGFDVHEVDGATMRAAIRQLAAGRARGRVRRVC